MQLSNKEVQAAFEVLATQLFCAILTQHVFIFLQGFKPFCLSSKSANKSKRNSKTEAALSAIQEIEFSCYFTAHGAIKEQSLSKSDRFTNRSTNSKLWRKVNVHEGGGKSPRFEI